MCLTLQVMRSLSMKNTKVGDLHAGCGGRRIMVVETGELCRKAKVCLSKNKSKNIRFLDMSSDSKRSII